jgi:hypothetical protein
MLSSLSSAERRQRIFAARSGAPEVDKEVEEIVREGVKIQRFKAVSGDGDVVVVFVGEVEEKEEEGVLMTWNFRTPWVDTAVRRWAVSQSSAL